MLDIAPVLEDDHLIRAPRILLETHLQEQLSWPCRIANGNTVFPIFITELQQGYSHNLLQMNEARNTDKKDNLWDERVGSDIDTKYSASEHEGVIDDAGKDLLQPNETGIGDKEGKAGDDRVGSDIATKYSTSEHDGVIEVAFKEFSQKNILTKDEEGKLSNTTGSEVVEDLDLNNETTRPSQEIPILKVDGTKNTRDSTKDRIKWNHRKGSNTESSGSLHDSATSPDMVNGSSSSSLCQNVQPAPNAKNKSGLFSVSRKGSAMLKKMEKLKVTAKRGRPKKLKGSKQSENKFFTIPKKYQMPPLDTKGLTEKELEAMLVLETAENIGLSQIQDREETLLKIKERLFN